MRVVAPSLAGWLQRCSGCCCSVSATGEVGLNLHASNYLLACVPDIDGFLPSVETYRAPQGGAPTRTREIRALAMLAITRDSVVCPAGFIDLRLGKCPAGSRVFSGYVMLSEGA